MFVKGWLGCAHLDLCALRAASCNVAFQKPALSFSFWICLPWRIHLNEFPISILAGRALRQGYNILICKGELVCSLVGKRVNNDGSWCQTLDSPCPGWGAGASQTPGQPIPAPVSELWDLEPGISTPLSLSFLIYKIRKIAPNVQQALLEIRDTNKQQGNTC